MDRDANLEAVRTRSTPWDIVIIGGGATGAGCALDGASRGFDVLLIEQHDFGKGTSSRSTKLVHGGVRYLRQGNIPLVREALKERGILLKNAPHVVHRQPFVIPCYSFFDKAFYGLGLRLYDRLSGKYGIGDSRILSRAETLDILPSIEPEGLSGGVLYYDGQFDDIRFLIDLLRTADAHGAVVVNYAKALSLNKDESGRICSVEFVDQETGEIFHAASNAVINAAGVFCDGVRRMSDADAKPVVTFAQGIHIVLGREFVAGDHAVMIPKTSDGRVLFCIPWHDRVLIGTTDTPVEAAVLEPSALRSEIDFVLQTAGAHLARKPARSDILSVFAGIRPLVASDKTRKTSSLSRGHELFVDGSGLITITGGKWTTYRRMAQDAVDKAIEVARLKQAECRTEALRIIGPVEAGSGEPFHPGFPYSEGDVVRAVRDEMARTIEDAIARRMRVLFLDAAAAVEIAPEVATVMARELGKGDPWIAGQIDDLKAVAAGYLAR